MEVLRSLVNALADDSTCSRQERCRAEEHYPDVMDELAMHLDEYFFWDKRHCSNVERDMDGSGQLRFMWYWRGTSACCLFDPNGRVQLMFYVTSPQYPEGRASTGSENTNIENLRDVLTSGRWDAYIPPK